MTSNKHWDELLTLPGENGLEFWEPQKCSSVLKKKLSIESQIKGIV